MASVASSSLSGFETDENSTDFVLINSNDGSIYIPSPASGSIGSFVMIGHNGQIIAPSPPAASPLYLDSGSEAAASMSARTFGEAGGSSNFMAASMEPNQDLYSINLENLEDGGDMMGTDLTSLDYLSGPVLLRDLSPYNMGTISATSNPDPFGMLDQTQFMDFGPPQSAQAESNAVPWTPFLYSMDGYTSPQPTSASISPIPLSAEPASPELKQEPSIAKASISSPIRRVRGTGVRVEKKRDTSSSASSSLGGSPTSKFVIVTPNTISAHAGKANPYECLEAMRPSQKGRKGPLANDTKENALQVRRRGACFHCHARKVKCDKERPCKNCRKLIQDVPQVVCWQFPDFLPILFPGFIRGHFDNKVLLEFNKDNIEEFRINGNERACDVELSSGRLFQKKLRIHAKFFTAKGSEINQHWHMIAQGDEVDLRLQQSAPIGLETKTGSPKDELRKMLKEPVKDYIESLIKEKFFADQVTETLERVSWVPLRVMEIVHRYFQLSDQPILKRALSICVMHFVMTRQLTLWSIQGNDVPMNKYWSTARLLNRQVKAIIDELLQKEMSKVFEDFSRALKSKSRKEWAPCLAAFLVSCFFMEAIEYAADSFVTSENDLCQQQNRPLAYNRKFALDINRKIENMPFKQFAFQFHQVFLTHNKEASAKAFNPLDDDALLESDDLDPAAAYMARELKNLVELKPNRAELERLAGEPILPNIDAHPFPRNTANDYIGRLVAKFLLSFKEEKYIYEPRASSGE